MIARAAIAERLAALPLPGWLAAVRLPAGWLPLTLPKALALSVALHAVLLAVQFVPPVLPRLLHDQALDVILVNSKSAHRPKHAQALAQANLDGGGQSQANDRASTPLPPSRSSQHGDDLEQTRRRVQALEARQQMLYSQQKTKLRTQQEASKLQPEPAQPLSGHDLASRALAMARLEAEIGQRINDYNKQPRRKFVGVRTEEFSAARYIEDWRQKVERIGTLNYPEAARGKLYGSLVLTVALRADGSIERIEVNRSSGHAILDEAARRIVTMAAPYAVFPPELRRDTDILEFTRTWSFTRNDQVQAQ